MIKTIATCLLVFFSIHLVSSQTPELDSLENILKNHLQQDTVRVDLLNEISLKSNRYDLSKTFTYGLAAKKIADQIGYKKGKAQSLRLIGEYYMRKSQPSGDTALIHMEESLELFRSLNDSLGMGMTYRSLGTCYFFLNDYFKSLKNSHESLKILEGLGLKGEIANILTNIGSLHSIQYNHEEALDYYTRALTIFEELESKFKIAVCLFNISDLQINFGEYEKALKNLEQSMVILYELNLKTMIPSALNNLGNIKNKQGHYEEAMVYYSEALDQSETLGLKGTACDNLIGLAVAHHALGNYNKAETYGLRGLALADEMSILERQKRVQAILAKVYEAKGNYKKAYNYHKKFKALSDSVFNEQNIKKLAGIEFQYEFDKEKQALLLEQHRKEDSQAAELRRQKMVRNAFIYGFILVVLLVFAVAYSLIQKQKANKKLTALNKSKDDIFAIVAHDLRAPVGNIKAFIELILANEKNYDQKETMAIMARLGTQSASVFNMLENLFAWANSERQNIVMKTQDQSLNRAVENNILLLKDNAQNKNIKVVNNVDSALSAVFDQNLISTVVRNLLANAIKFTPDNGEVSIDASDEGDAVRLSVTDNGVGIEPEKAQSLFDQEVFETTPGTNEETGSGLGLKLCYEFVAKHNGRIWAESEVGTGSTFSFTLPKGT